jgi:hypothetical protein
LRDVNTLERGRSASLRSSNAARDLSRIDWKRAIADILSHGSHEYDILDLHLACLV